MKFMMIVRANEDTEAGVRPSEELITQMTDYNEQLVKAGVLLDGQGLLPSSKGARVNLNGDRPVTDGPFAEAKELIAGYWVIEVQSRDEAIEWARRVPNPHGGPGAIDLLQIATAEDFGDEFTEELQAREEELSKQVKAQRNA